MVKCDFCPNESDFENHFEQHLKEPRYVNICRGCHTRMHTIHAYPHGDRGYNDLIQTILRLKKMKGKTFYEFEFWFYFKLACMFSKKGRNQEAKERNKCFRQYARTGRKLGLPLFIYNW